MPGTSTLPLEPAQSIVPPEQIPALVVVGRNVQVAVSVYIMVDAAI